MAQQSCVLGQDRLAVSFHSFGEATTLPVRIQKATFQVFPVAAIAQNLVQLDLTVVNDVVEGEIAAKLKMPLPVGAAICRFEFFREDQWYPAVPVPAQKAKEVVYKEKEKGRKVAAAAQVQGNVFEIEVSPLKYKCPSQCRLWYCHGDPTLPFDFDPDTEVETKRQHEEDAQHAADSSGACVGDCFGQRHFACYVPFVLAPGVQAPQRIAVLWDTSGSQGGDHSLRFGRLRGLATECPSTKFDVWTFGISFKRELEAVDVEEMIAKLETTEYDGGTDFALLPSIVAAVGPVDAVLLFSDGMDSLDRQPLVLEAAPPIHCVADRPNINVSNLSIMCLATGGNLLKSDYLPMLKPRTLLAHIETDQDDEAFFNTEDSFKCCPDHRLHLQWPIGEEGLWLCGTLGGVTKVTAKLTVGRETKEFHFDLTTAHVLSSGAAPLLGYLFARQQYSAVERDGASMGMDLTKIRAELATRYGFCSPESTLLMLYDACQFIENQIDCPKDHPAHSVWKASQVISEPADLKGDLGQPKTESQMEIVTSLAQRLDAYMKQPAPEKKKAKKEHAARGRERGVARARARGRELEACDGARSLDCDSASEASSASMCEETRCMAAPMARMACMEVREEEACMMACPVEEAACLHACFDDEPLQMEAACAAECFSSAFDMEAARPAERASVASSASGCDGASSADRGAAAAPAQSDSEDGGASSQVSSASQGGASVQRDCEGYVQGKEQGYLEVLGEALKSGSWPEAYKKLRGENAASPSFFLYSADLVLGHSPQNAEAAARICTNCLEINLQDVQMMRSVGYFLIKAGQTPLALAVLDRVRELAPVEPQSYLDGALARAVDLLGGKFCEEHFRKALELITIVLTHTWADRFQEVEWPALILLHMLIQVGDKKGIKDLWPAALKASLRSSEFAAGLVVWLGWDTDKTDIDLHVVEPSGNEVYYSNPRSSIGGHLSKDFTQGYGPEVYLCKQPAVGKYTVKAKYYASHQQSALTGATSAVIWALQGGPNPELKFDTVRLDRNKEMMEVMEVSVAAAPPLQAATSTAAAAAAADVAAAATAADGEKAAPAAPAAFATAVSTASGTEKEDDEDALVREGAEAGGLCGRLAELCRPRSP